MILTVTLNAALDVTYGLTRVEMGRANRVRDVARRPGGKGVNVSRVLRALGADTMVTGLAGGATGDAIRAGLAEEGIAERLVTVSAESRRTLVVAEADRVTLLNEPGPPLGDGEWRAFSSCYRDLVAQSEAVVLSGSLPPGVPADAYATLAGIAGRHNVPVLLDADGDALRLGVAGRPLVVKANLGEVRRAVGGSPSGLPAAAARLHAGGAEAVVVTLGEEGIFALAGERSHTAAPPERVTGNPTGAGDAVAAALVLGVLRATPWPERLADAVALGAAAVRAPLAGDVDLELYERWRPQVVVRES